MKKWWGDINFELNEAKTWRIGQRKISVQRKDAEWLISNEKTNEESFEELVLERATFTDPVIDILPQRYLVKNTQNSLIAKPLLADRSIIVRPHSALNVLPGEKIELYVSSPLWLAFYAHEGRLPISDLPFWLPSDSWFGPNTMVGELCYSKYTDAKVTLDNIQKRSHRAITTINISNEHDEVLTIERISLPAPFLNLYVDATHQFWTDKVCLIHHLDGDRPSFAIKNLTKESEKTDLTLISPAREMADENTFMRSIRSLVA
ncbi:hypothetical protein [Paraglaciecola sp. MB-3u-78]|jgi:hypothetical protein|uniref:hypothetical protein n=1 Tax=Paraglaciecola sp. MB-3u-78 TaxID=2058332 RepID=UPI000C3206DF|nr:hypothetical protein [Paraglaciecola sp. MB-3u-78]PKG97719.1 hypothetical protein CXF95_14790 [Paraglaciecola sp. MB-3u-78]